MYFVTFISGHQKGNYNRMKGGHYYESQISLTFSCNIRYFYICMPLAGVVFRFGGLVNTPLGALFVKKNTKC